MEQLELGDLSCEWAKHYESLYFQKSCSLGIFSPQDQGCLPGLVIFLDNDNPQVVTTALEVCVRCISHVRRFVLEHGFYTKYCCLPYSGIEFSCSSTFQSTADEEWSWSTHQHKENHEQVGMHWSFPCLTILSVQVLWPLICWGVGIFQEGMTLLWDVPPSPHHYNVLVLAGKERLCFVFKCGSTEC